ncbi:MAG: ABC transporter substrate-binding protein [Kiloniellales bacterium]
MKKSITAALLGLGAAFVLALAPAQGPARAATPDDVLVMAKNIDDIINLDPAEVFEFSGGEVIANVYDRITMFEPEDLETLVGGVAESWEISGDGKTFTFKIRPGLTFHSGNPVTAEDAAFSLQRVVILDKSPAFILTQFGWNADNVGDLVKALDDETLQLTITEDFAPTLVLNALQAGVGSVVDKTLVLEHEKDGDLGYEWLKTNSAGSGAFVLRSWKANESVVLEANPDYRHGAPGVKRVIIRHVPEPAVRRLLVEKGDVDLARDLTTDQVSGVEGAPGLTLVASPKAQLHYVSTNDLHPILGKPKVRQAMRWLIDYQGMVDSFLKGNFQMHQAFWPAGFYDALNDTPFHLDVAKAKVMLAEAGYPDGFEVTMDAFNVSPQKEMAESIQATMAQAGIKVEILPAERKAVYTKHRARSHELILSGWGPDYLDPHSNADSFASNPDNRDEAKLTGQLAWRGGWDMPEITALTAAARKETDAAKRKEMYLDLQRRVQEDGPFIIMFQGAELNIQRDNLKGFVSGPNFDLVFYRNTTK